MPIERLHNENALVEDMQLGNEESFTILYRHYSPLLYLNILRMVREPAVAEEMVQELFCRIWQNRSSRAIKENFSGYLYRVALNLVHDFFRKLKRDGKLLEKFSHLTDVSYHHIEETINSRESRQSLKMAIEHLPPQQKKVYQLVREEGLTYKKAAEVLNISPLTVKEYLASTTKTIRRFLLHHADGITIFVLLVSSALRF